MESIAWVEMLGPRGHVLRRDPAFIWPIRLGHHYVGDVVVDDKTFPDSRIELSRADGGQAVLIFCLDQWSDESVNSHQLRLNGKAVTIDNTGRFVISGNDVLECGATRLRIRMRGHEVDRSPSSSTIKWTESWMLAIAVAFVAMTWNGYFSFAISLEEDAAAQLTEATKTMPMMLLWWGFWATVSRLVSGFSHAREHLLITGILFLLHPNWNQIGSAIAFSTGIYSFTMVGEVLKIFALGIAFYAHLSFVKQTRTSVGLIRSALVTGFVWVWMLDGGLVFYSPEKRPMDYDTSMWPTSIVITSGDSAEHFFQGVDKAKAKIDQSAALIASRH